VVEQRRERRVQVQYPISFEGNQGPGKGKLFNLSLRGCGIESGVVVQVGATVTLRVYVPTHKEPIRIGRAGVTWSAGQDFGVEFTDVDPAERERLQKLINDLQEGKSNIH
jgi:c-di-GMP-binding flagellar brake protein YcgR